MMADRIPPIKTASRKRGSNETRDVQHLKPLSIYSHMVFQEATKSCLGNPSWSPECPSWNLKDVLDNGRGSVRCKRRLDDSCLDETYDTPAKKPCLDKRPSPDSACVINSFNASRQVHLDSLQSSSVVLDEIRRVEKTLSDQKSLGLGWIDGQSSASLPDVSSSSPVMVDSADGLAFDYEVDEIMRLSPIESADVSADGLEDFIQSCQNHYEDQLPAEEGSSSWCSSRHKQGILECSLGKDAHPGSDEGYVTKSYYTADPGESKVTAESELSKDDFIKSYKITVLNYLPEDKSPLVSTPIKSTPLGKFRELVKRSPILSPKSDLHKECRSSPAVMYEPVSSISLSEYVDLDTSNNEALPTIHFVNVDESKEGVVVPEGTPIHKSLACHNQEKRTDTHVDEHVLSVSQQQAHSDTGVTFGEETDAADSFESTLPLQVQVKSKVVLISLPQPGVTAHQQPEKKAASEGQRNSFKDVPRPVVLYREEDWEKEKKTYVDLVTGHMTDNTEDGVMTELLHLMNSVANQGRGSDGRKWQHPSDLTRRNYRLRNRNRLLSLDEWQNLNYRNHRRFAEVPQVFKRSPVL